MVPRETSVGPQTVGRKVPEEDNPNRQGEGKIVTERMSQALLADQLHPEWLKCAVDNHENQLVDHQADDADDSKLNELTASMTGLTFRESPAPIQHKVLDHRGREPEGIGGLFAEAHKLNQNIQNEKMGNCPCCANGGKFDEAFHFNAVGTGKSQRICDQC